MLDGAYVIRTQFCVHVDGRNTLVVARRPGGIRRGKSGTALLKVPGLVAALSCTRYRQRENAVGVTVAVARVRVSAAVP